MWLFFVEWCIGIPSFIASIDLVHRSVANLIVPTVYDQCDKQNGLVLWMKQHKSQIIGIRKLSRFGIAAAPAHCISPRYPAIHAEICHTANAVMEKWCFKLHIFKLLSELHIERKHFFSDWTLSHKSWIGVSIGVNIMNCLHQSWNKF